jgi:hypothetical protein
MQHLVPDITGDVEVQQLASRLEALAQHLDDNLKEARAQTGTTLVHGDFKTANLFFCKASAPSFSQTAVCTPGLDGCPVADVTVSAHLFPSTESLFLQSNNCR